LLAQLKNLRKERAATLTPGRPGGRPYDGPTLALADLLDRAEALALCRRLKEDTRRWAEELQADRERQFKERAQRTWEVLPAGLRDRLEEANRLCNPHFPNGDPFPLVKHFGVRPVREAKEYLLKSAGFLGYSRECLALLWEALTLAEAAEGKG
jgi:hypothetical protein